MRPINQTIDNITKNIRYTKDKKICIYSKWDVTNDEIGYIKILNGMYDGSECIFYFYSKEENCGVMNLINFIKNCRKFNAINRS